MMTGLLSAGYRVPPDFGISFYLIGCACADGRDLESKRASCEK